MVTGFEIAAYLDETNRTMENAVDVSAFLFSFPDEVHWGLLMDAKKKDIFLLRFLFCLNILKRKQKQKKFPFDEFSFFFFFFFFLYKKKKKFNSLHFLKTTFTFLSKNNNIE